MLLADVVVQGLSVTKATKNCMLAVGFVSEDHSMKTQTIGDYIAYERWWR
ncbi:hypothetical protein [Bradyrhizobium sp. ARR65]|nr:hypothetical protein [Bradyrhizobium sp. ARR65]